MTDADRLREIEAAEALRRLQAQHKPGGNEIHVTFRDDGKRVGRRDFATHWLHWYPAKMFHRIPGIFLDVVPLAPGCHILDPFCGSGTVLLEANLRGFRATGIDISPLARTISHVKVTPLAPDMLRRQLEATLTTAKSFRSKPAAHPILDTWLPAAARNSLHRLGRAIDDIRDEDVRAFFLVAMTTIVRGVSNADPAIPPLVRLNAERAERAGSRYQRALRRSERLTGMAVYDSFRRAATANIRRMGELYALRSDLGQSQVLNNDAHAACTTLESQSVDAVITSPPYCGAQKYVRSTKLELLLSGTDSEVLRDLDRRMLGTEAITSRPSVLGDLLTHDPLIDDVVTRIHRANPVRARMAADYSAYISEFVRECHRILRPGGHLVVAIARNRMGGVLFPTDRVLRSVALRTGFEYVGTLVDRIPSRGMLTARHKSSSRIDYERIVWLRSPASPSAFK